MRVETIKCDVCGKIKGEGNGWFVTRTTSRSFIIRIGDEQMNGDGTVEDICSNPCMMKRVQAVLSVAKEVPHE